MRRRQGIRRAGFAVAALAALGAGAPDEPIPTLRFNPFGPLTTSGSAQRADGLDPAQAELPWSPLLSGTVLAGSASLVNLGGVVLRVGEEAHGYKLVEVRAGEAVFERAGTRVVLSVDDAPER